MKRCPICGNMSYTPLAGYFENLKQQGFEWNAEDFEFLNVVEYFCSRCRANDRDRLIAYYVSKNRYDNCLHIAPSAPLNDYLTTEIPTVETMDLFMAGVTHKEDITDMPNIKDGTYDLVICSHILEHVDNDSKAVAEIVRVLKLGGEAVLLVPVCLPLPEKIEDLTASVSERIRRFSQDDHVRMYNKKSFTDLLTVNDTQLSIYGIEDAGAENFSRMGLTSTSVLYILRKK